jgi:hypothetical protein
LFCFVFIGSAGDVSQGLAHARQALHHSRTLSPGTVLYLFLMDFIYLICFRAALGMQHN